MNYVQLPVKGQLTHMYQYYHTDKWVVDGPVTAILSLEEALCEIIGLGGHDIKQKTSEMNSVTKKTPKDMYHMTP